MDTSFIPIQLCRLRVYFILSVAVEGMQEKICSTQNTSSCLCVNVSVQHRVSFLAHEVNKKLSGIIILVMYLMLHTFLRIERRLWFQATFLVRL